MKQFIIEVPENETFDDLNEDAKASIASLQGQYAQGNLVGSESFEGYRLKLVLANIEPEAFEELIDNTLGLDWLIVASEGVEIEPALILPYMSDISVFDDEDEVVSSEEVTDITDKLQTFSGRVWSY